MKGGKSMLKRIVLLIIFYGLLPIIVNAEQNDTSLLPIPPVVNKELEEKRLVSHIQFDIPQFKENVDIFNSKQIGNLIIKPKIDTNIISYTINNKLNTSNIFENITLNELLPILKIKAVDESGNIFVAEHQLKIDDTCPTVTVKSILNSDNDVEHTIIATDTLPTLNEKNEAVSGLHSKPFLIRKTRLKHYDTLETYIQMYDEANWTDVATFKTDTQSKIFVYVRDNAGNISEYIVNPYDTTPPKINYIYFNQENKTSNFLSFGNFFNESLIIKVDAVDEKGNLDEYASGIKLYELIFKRDNSNETVKLSSSDGNFIINQENLYLFKGKIFVIVHDNVGNTIETVVNQKNSNLNEEGLDALKGHIILDSALPNIQLKNEKEVNQKYFNQSFDLIIEANDIGTNQSGISYFNIYANDTNIYRSEKLTTFQTIIEKILHVDVFDRKINNAKLAHWNNGIILLKGEVIDNAGNYITIDLGTFFIDTLAPVTNINFDKYNNDSFYGENRTAFISIQEQNFDKVMIYGTHNGKEYRIEPNFKAVGSGENKTWQMPIVYTMDGEYTLSVQAIDKLGNVGNIETIMPFIIDKTKPVVSVIYDNNSVKNELFFNKNRVVKINIQEKNFDKNRVRFNSDIPNIKWDHFDDNHIATIIYANDGEYHLSFNVLDKANNIGDITFLGHATNHFIIDKTISAPIITNVMPNKSYNKIIQPNILFEDLHYDSYSVKLYQTTLNSKTKDVTHLHYVNENTHAQGSNVIYQLLNKANNSDGLYTLVATIYDKAGNSATSTLTFTINQNGSKYSYNNYLTSINHRYLKNVIEDLIVQEYNLSPLSASTIYISRNGELLRDIKINKISYTSSANYQYHYIVSKDNFTHDGIYKVMLLSQDIAGNVKESKPISFIIDTTKPQLMSLIGLETAIINSNEQIINYELYDALGLDNIKIYIDNHLISDQMIHTDQLNNYISSFKINESSRKQHIRLVITDKAGNQLDTDDKDFQPVFLFEKDVLLSTNFFVRLYSNKMLLALCLIFIVIIVSSIILFFIVRSVKRSSLTK